MAHLWGRTGNPQIFRAVVPLKKRLPGIISAFTAKCSPLISRRAARVTWAASPGGTLWDKMNYAVGIEYGYSLPVGRRLNLDFVLGVGYWGGEYQKYDPIDNHYLWKETRQRHWVGPTKAEVSLVWLIGRGNYNEKGGKR